jgi:hypothetical protein
MHPFRTLRKLFVLPSADLLALQQLEETERHLLRAEAALELAQATVNMYERRHQRLKARISASHNPRKEAA